MKLTVDIECEIEFDRAVPIRPEQTAMAMVKDGLGTYTDIRIKKIRTRRQTKADTG